MAPRGPSASALLRSINVVALAGVIGQLLGFLREVVLSAFFGASVATDAYYLSFSIPDLFLQLTLAGGLTSAIVPLLSAEEREPAFGGPPAVARSLLEGYTVLAAAAAALGVIIMPWLIARLAPGFDAPTQRLATNLGRVMILSLPFLTAAAVATGYLNFRRSFAIPALRPAVQSLAVIAGVILLYRRFGVYSAAGGVTVGAMVGAVGLVWLMLRKSDAHSGRKRARAQLFGRYLRLALPIVLTGLVIQVSIIAEKTAATGFAAGSVASLAFARRIAFLAIALGAQPITVVFFPELASAFARGQAGVFRRHLRTAIVVTALALIPGALILGGFAQPITQLLLERGMFRAEDTARVAGLLRVYAVGVPVFAANSIMVFALHARQRVWAPLAIGLGTFGLYVLLLWTLPGRLGLPGIVTSLVVAEAVRLAILTTIVWTQDRHLSISSRRPTPGQPDDDTAPESAP